VRVDGSSSITNTSWRFLHEPFPLPGGRETCFFQFLAQLDYDLRKGKCSRKDGVSEPIGPVIERNYCEDQTRVLLGAEYVPQFNQRFSKPAAQRGTAFVPLRRKDLDLVFSLQHERIVARDNTVSFASQTWQLERCKWRATLASCRVTIHEHLDQAISITFGPHLVSRYNAAAGPLEFQSKTVEMVGKSGQKAA
jgi:hypothetical protein